MKKQILLISNLIIVFAIIAGFIAIVYRDTKTYQALGEEHLENIVSLADITISKQIENAMTRPVMVSKTMANDEFLKEWLSHEADRHEDAAYLDELYHYLKAYQLKYDYNTVFCISAATGNYYYQDGFNKTLSKSDSHDIWYYNFTESGHEYDLEIDTNEANNDHITVFVNFRVEDADGNLMGIIGVGLQVSSIEHTIRTYEKDYDLSVYIINVGGVETSFSGDTDIFIKEDTLAKRTGIQQEITISKSDASKIQWFTSGAQRKCLITTYDNTLGWYLILEKDISSISSAFQRGIKNNIIFMLISLTACIVVTTVVFILYNQRVVKIENTDELTGLPNRKLFLKQLPAFLLKNPEQEKVLFMFDIDRFKNINDTYGHLFGNGILTMVGKDVQKAIEGCGVVSRWGGDEFLGILMASPDEARQTITKFMKMLESEETNMPYPVTVSTGMVAFDKKSTSDSIIKKVDKALYCSKAAGRNQITIL